MRYWLGPRLARYLSQVCLSSLSLSLSLSLANSCQFEKSGERARKGNARHMCDGIGTS